MGKFTKLVETIERIDELRDVPIVGWESVNDLLRWVQNKLGYEYLGSGTYSTVYGKGDYVIKIQNSGIPTSRPMRCNIRFHRMALNSDNPHLPKVYFVKVYKDEDGTHKYVFGTERLERIKLRYIDPKDFSLPKDLIEAAIFISFLWRRGIVHENDAINYIDQLPYLPDIQPDQIERLISLSDQLYDENHHLYDRNRLSKLASEWKKVNHPFIDAYKQVITLMNDEQCFMDFAIRNIMLRKDGTIVIVDPIADRLRDWW